MPRFLLKKAKPGYDPKPLYVYQIKFAFNLLYSVRDGIQRVK